MGKRKVQCRDGQAESEMAELSENGAGAGKTFEKQGETEGFPKDGVKSKVPRGGLLARLLRLRLGSANTLIVLGPVGQGSKYLLH